MQTIGGSERLRSPQLLRSPSLYLAMTDTRLPAFSASGPSPTEGWLPGSPGLLSGHEVELTVWRVLALTSWSRDSPAPTLGPLPIAGVAGEPCALGISWKTSTEEL